MALIYSIHTRRMWCCSVCVFLGAFPRYDQYASVREYRGASAISWLHDALSSTEVCSYQHFSLPLPCLATLLLATEVLSASRNSESFAWTNSSEAQRSLRLRLRDQIRWRDEGSYPKLVQVGTALTYSTDGSGSSEEKKWCLKCRARDRRKACLRSW